MQNRAAVIKALAEKLGLEGLATLQVEAVRHRPVPLRLLARLTQPDHLSPRQRQCMVLLASGFTRQEIADELGVSLETVKTTIKWTYLKLDVHNKVDAINAFLEWEA